MSSPSKTKKRFPYNQHVYRMCVLLTSDIVKAICDGKMTHDLPPEFFQAKAFAVRVIMKESGMTKEQTRQFVQDFALNWTLDKVPIFPDQTEDEVSTETNPEAEDVLDILLSHAVYEYMKNHPE